MALEGWVNEGEGEGVEVLRKRASLYSITRTTRSNFQALP